MQGRSKPVNNSWSDAIQDFRWLEVPYLQHLIGAIVSAICIKLCLKQSIWPVDASSKRTILIASIVNVVGNMATYAASSSMTQVVKVCEPLFMFGLSFWLYRDYRAFNSTTRLAIVMMVIGASSFVAYDRTFLVTGLLAAVCSDVAFPIRNMNRVWESSIQKYAALSLCSVLVLTPFIFLKLIFSRSISFWNMSHHFQGVISSSFHCIYNLASIYVLQNFTPLTHAILNLLNVIVTNIAYFQLPVSWKIVIGLATVFIGLYIYHKNVREFPPWMVLVLIAALGLIFSGSISTTDRTSNNLGEDEIIPSRVVRSAWVYDRPMSKKILGNLEYLSKHSPVLVYCGTSHCMQAIKDLSNKRLFTKFLFIRELVHGTPLEKWLDKHALYKVLAKTLFEDHLQKVARLGVLWKYGGVYVEPNVQLDNDVTNPFSLCIDRPWIAVPITKDSIQHLKLACFPEQHLFIKNMSTIIVNEYFRGYKQVPTMTVDTNLYLNESAVTTIKMNYNVLSVETDQPWNHHYGTLSYDCRNTQVPDTNVGDEIQGFSGLQYIPFLDHFVDRDNITSSKSYHTITTFFNAWWASRHAKWPPPQNIDPILFSIHIGVPMQPQWRSNSRYLMERAPIGCRDYGTVHFFSKLSVPAYFSGCMTLMLQMKSERTEEIFITDVKEEYFTMLPKIIKEEGIRLNHFMTGDGRWVGEGRFIEGYKMLERYARAKLVITQRIHCALPCVAMGTPVIFINSAKMPGGGGNNTQSSDRTVGLTSMFHTFDNYKMKKTEGQKWFADFPWNNPPPNPDMATMMRLRATFWYEIRQRPSLFDAAHKFGLIPMSPPSPCTSHLRFHIHFSLPDSKFTWQDHRSIESIFRHHPCADVVLHSNTLKENRFNLFRESGYRVNVAQYDLDNLFQGTNLERYRNNVLGDSNPYLIGAVVLYKWGGIYMDSHIIITQSLDHLPKNFLVQISSKSKIELSLMGFEKESKYLELAVSQYAADIKLRKYPSSIYANLTDTVKILNNDNFVFVEQCQQLYNGPKYKAFDPIKLKESTLAVSLPSDFSLTKTLGTVPLKSETLCKHVLQDFCVICSKLL